MVRNRRLAHNGAMIPRAVRSRLLLPGLWVLFGLISGIQIQISMLSHHHAWPLMIGYQVLVWSLWILSLIHI